MACRATQPKRQNAPSYANGALGSVCMKTRLCCFYIKGSCPRGRKCKFAHGEEELQSAPDLTRTKMCPAMLRSGVCRRGTSCRFAHTESELRPIEEVMPEPALGAALVAVWRQRSERWSDFSTDSDHAESEISSPEGSGREPQAMCDDFCDVPVSSRPTHPRKSCSSGVVVIDESFLVASDQMGEGCRMLHAPTGLSLAIRNTFIDLDERRVGHGGAKRCSSASARFGVPQPLM